MPIIPPLTIKAGWVTATALGFRIYESQRGRYFRDVVRARARETVTWKRNQARSSANQRREPYLASYYHHGHNLPRAVRRYDALPDGAA